MWKGRRNYFVLALDPHRSVGGQSEENICPFGGSSNSQIESKSIKKKSDLYVMALILQVCYDRAGSVYRSHKSAGRGRRLRNTFADGQIGLPCRDVVRPFVAGFHPP